MANGDRIIVGNIVPGVLYLQPGAKYTTTDKGFDTGSASFITHWNTPESKWPKRGDASLPYRFMFASSVTRADHESTGLREFDVTYRGIKEGAANGPQKVRITERTSVKVLYYPVLKIYLSLTTPRIEKEYVSLSAPSKSGLGAQLGEGLSPTGYPDTASAILPDGSILNYAGVWILEARDNEEAVEGRGVFEVKDSLSFFITGPAT